MAETPSHEPPTPSGPEADAEPDSSSTGTKKLLLGCGCGILSMVVLCTGAAGALWFSAYSFLPDDAEQLVRRLQKLADEQPVRSGDAGGYFGAEFNQQNASEFLGRRLSSEDVDAFVTSLDSFTSTDAFREQKKTADEIRNITGPGGDAGPIDRLQGAWSFTEYATQSNALEKAFRETIGDADARRQFFSRMIRIAALMSAADLAASRMQADGDQPPDPLSDPVATYMLEQRETLSTKYQSKFQKALDSLENHQNADVSDNTKMPRKLAERLKQLQPAMKMAAQPGLIAFGRLDASAFQTWADLSTDSRQGLVDRMRELAGLFPFANAELGLKAFQYMLTAPERARLQHAYTQ